MSERGKRVVRVLLDRERDVDVVERIEQQGSIIGYLRTLVRRDIHDERLDFAMMKVAELQAENEALRELLQDVAICACGRYCHGCPHQYDGCDRDERLRELGVEVEA